MTLKIKFNDNFIKNNLLVFCNDKKKLPDLSNLLNKNQINFIKKFIDECDFKKKKFFDLNIDPKHKIAIVNFNPKSKQNLTLEIEELGAKIYDQFKLLNIFSIFTIKENLEYFLKLDKKFINKFLFGMFLRSYNFQKYKTKIDKNHISITLPKGLEKKISEFDSKYMSLVEGINFTKDLVSEPGNILHPDEYVNRLKKLKSLGLKVTIFDKYKLKKLGMSALLGVGQGSVRGSYLATIEWNGSSKKKQPIAFVGKGVCFDTGGISLKPAKFMEDMTYDMAGSAVVVGLMKTLALRKAKVNVVGVVGLVENMPDGNAQRPGDIVKSYSGKTIEILNTDAEGRLVLADALSYTEKKFKPKFIVDLATLTGAIIVSLGSEYAGLFSNDDKISDQLSKAGEKVGEKVWRMPLNDNYDKLIDSKKADMQNINYVGGAGSTTAAQFLQRFILNKTPWAHLDIAGMAFSKYGGALNSGGATGYGVRLLNQLIEDNYE
jgi:leucyl aminopeptidase